MEKNTPAYNLASIKNAFSNVESLVMSSKALRNLTTQGISPEDLVTAIQALIPENFMLSISLSSEEDEAVWQDVYSSPLLKRFILKVQEARAGHFIIC